MSACFLRSSTVLYVGPVDDCPPATISSRSDLYCGQQSSRGPEAATTDGPAIAFTKTTTTATRPSCQAAQSVSSQLDRHSAHLLFSAFRRPANVQFVLSRTSPCVHQLIIPLLPSRVDGPDVFEPQQPFDNFKRIFSLFPGTVSAYRSRSAVSAKAHLTRGTHGVWRPTVCVDTATVFYGFFRAHQFS